ncbi:SgcJ/EcaC family oxidoreductase [Citrobacter freundii]|uniref:SgcJ/EcaC family oxidoreductase n=1 Tax=Citrobacter freundii TaxID=546 RepID=A0ABD7AY13_CITFR|nr:MULTISPECIES: SgcJ/EcaC family oxidoreductase [Citrobacter freundii complex]QLX25580.1 SgcJ/EcaC family oxidoreductase [Citrobacter freundii]QLY37078.1 SgcJ/EcaC family oxidoreductase [Citrobacter freundii]QMA47397.1 SgcJ/EcaC family oxidoreductase [Citrobacter freundii]
MKKLFGLIASLTLLSGPVLAVSAPDCVKVDNAQIEALFDKWNASLKTGNAKTVSENYLSDAVLLPTVSNKARLTDAERIDYFEHFLAKKPTGKIDTRTIRLGCNKAIDTGTYTFTFADKSTVSARYTFTYAWDGKEWKISTHHSSAMPEG